MKCLCFCVAIIIIFVKCSPAEGIFLVVPEDVATGSAAVYGFSPRIFRASDHRFGLGFRLGSHADLQILYELGPQTLTRPLAPPPPIRVRSARSRRRPLLEFLLRSVFLKELEHELEYSACDEPR